jgi:hypothetical protein
MKKATEEWDKWLENMTERLKNNKTEELKNMTY